MAEIQNNSGGGGVTGLAFIVGALVAVIAVIAFFLVDGSPGSGSKDVDVKIEAPKLAPNNSGGN